MMEPTTMFKNKGYGKVEESENDHLTHKGFEARRATKLTISAVVLLTVLVAVAIGALAYATNAESRKDSARLNSADSLRIVCNVTRYPDTCISSVSSLNSSPRSDPLTILNLSLRAAESELSNVTSFFKTVNSNLGDCGDLFDDAASRLNDSRSAIAGWAKAGGFDAGKVNDVQTWLSSALTDQDTCLDGLMEIESTALIEVKGRVEKTKELVSNSLAIAANFNSLLRKFGLKLH